MYTHPAPQPRRAPPDWRAKVPRPLPNRFFRLLHAGRSAARGWRSWVQAATVAPPWLPARWRHPLVGYVVALLIGVAVTSLARLLVTFVPSFDLQGVLLIVGVLLVALTCGVGPSLLATGVGLFLLEDVVRPASLSWRQHPVDWVDLVVLLASGISLSLLASQNSWARQKAEAMARSLSDAQARGDEERQRLRMLLEVLPVGVFIADATGQILETNPACRAIWGDACPLVDKIAEYGAYQGWWPGTDQRVAPEDWALARALQRGETTLQEEIEIQTFDGQRKTILNYAVPLRDATGAIAGGVVAILDISERKGLEAALRQSEREAAARARELEAIFEALTDGLLVYDAEGRVLRSNTAARQLLGFEAHPKFATLPWKERAARYAPVDAQGHLVLPEDLAVSRLLRGEVLTGAQTAEDSLQTPDGRTVAFSMTGRPLRDDEGTIMGAVGIARDETERRQLEREIAERAAQLETIFESIVDGVTVTDRQGRVLHMNQADRAFFGLELDPTGWALPELEELAGFASYTTAGQRLIEGDDPIPRVLQGEILTSEQSLDTILRTRSGREVRRNTTGAPVRDATGQLLGAVFVSRDVTEQRRLEREVAERAAQLETIFESMADGLTVTDRQGRVLHMNQAFRTFLGLEQDPTGRTLPELEELTGSAGYTPAGKRLIEGEDPLTRVLHGEVLTDEQSLDIIVRSRAGYETWTNTTGAPIRDATGQLLGAVLVSRDVTEQRRLEQQTREALDALLAMAQALVQGDGGVGAAEHRMLASDQTPQPGADSTLPVVAQRLAELTRRVLDCRSVSIAALDAKTEALTPVTVVGLSPADEQRWWSRWERQPHLGEVLPPSAVAALRAGELVLAERLPAPFLLWQQLSSVCPSILAPMRIGETLVGVLHVDGGAPGESYMTATSEALLGAIARLGALVLERERLLRDRTEAQARELALRETQAQMETFLGVAGHELKNPLSVLTLSLEMAERRMQRLEGDAAAAAELFAQHVTQTRQLAHRLERLVNDLVDLARVRVGKLELHPAAADLATIVREVVDEQGQANPERTLLLEAPPAQAVPITADADRIGQVVINYLTNALKYSPSDRPVAVGLDVDDHDQQARVARVWVRDEGPGLPLEEQERIWERFHRVNGIEVQSGTGVGLGLGLHICRTIIERHQGQVGVTSAPGQGSTFWFTLPLGGQQVVREEKPEEHELEPG